MLARIDLRERRERLEPRRLEISPSASDNVREVLARVRMEGDDALVEHPQRPLAESGGARAVEAHAMDQDTLP